MPDKKFSDAGSIALGNFSSTDTIWYLDKSDTTDGPGGTVKQAQLGDVKDMFSQKASVNALSLVGVDTTQSVFTYIAAAINAQGPFTANYGEMFLFFTTQSQVTLGDIGTASAIRTYFMVFTGRLNVGGGNQLDKVDSSDIIVSGGPIELNPANTPELFIELGDIGTSTVEDEFNLGDTSVPGPWTIAGEKFITCVISSVEKIYRFIGAAGDYGPSDLTSVAADFQDLSTEGTPVPYNETKPVYSSTFTKTDIQLDNHEGRAYYMGSSNSAIKYVIINNIKLFGWCLIKINAASEPSITDTVAIVSGSFVVGIEYTILTIGTTDFTLIGASANTIGVIFTATGVGTGTGTATTNSVKVGGSAFVASTDMYLRVGYNGERVEHYFVDYFQIPNPQELLVDGDTLTPVTALNKIITEDDIDVGDDVVVENEYADIATMLADQVNQTNTFLQYVTDASADPTVTSGEMYYEYLGTTVGDLTDYRKLSGDEITIIQKGNQRIQDQLGANFRAKFKTVYGAGFVATKRKDGGYNLSFIPSIGVSELKAELKATVDLGDVSGIVDIDWEAGIQYRFNMTADVTLTYSKLIENKTMFFSITGNASYVLTMAEAAGHDLTTLADFDTAGGQENLIQDFCDNATAKTFRTAMTTR